MSTIPSVRDPAADRNVLVMVEKDTPTVDDGGQAVPNWRPQFQRYAKVIARSSVEQLVFKQLRADVDWVVRMPFDPETARINPAAWRIALCGPNQNRRYLNLVSVIDVGMRHQTIELQCREVAV